MYSFNCSVFAMRNLKMPCIYGALCGSGFGYNYQGEGFMLRLDLIEPTPSNKPGRFYSRTEIQTEL